MADRQIELWINERWYDALSDQLKKQNTTVEEKLDEYLDALIDQLPEMISEKVGREIWEEDRQQREAAEAARRVSVFRITQDGRTDCLLTEGAASMDPLHTAMRLRAYLLAKGNSSRQFIKAIPAADHITPEVFRNYADEVLQSTGRVIAALDIDLDHGKFSTLSALNGWESYTARDVSAAAWYACRKGGLKWERRLDSFATYLDGKEITPEHRLNVSRISFADEIMEMEGRLNFYVENTFDPDHAFGTFVCTEENDDWVNVYANYDIGKEQVCGTLEVNLCRGNGTEKTMLYHLSPAEKKTLAEKMDVFCQKQTGLSLKDYCAQIQAGDIRVVEPDTPKKTSGASTPKKASKTRKADRGAR